MLWEIMFEMVIELLAVMGEILSTFWKVAQEAVKYFKKKPPVPPGKKAGMGAGGGGVGGSADGAAQASGGNGLILGITIVFVGVLVLSIPQVRHAIFHHRSGGGSASGSTAGDSADSADSAEADAPPGSVITEKPRNPMPMGEYTFNFYKLKRFAVEDNGVTRNIYFYWYAPKTAPGQKLPLVVVLHGKEGMDQAAMYLRTAAVQKEFPAFLLIPQSPQGKIWDAPAKYSGQEFPPTAPQPPPPGPQGRSLQDVIMLLARVTDRNPIDQDRMYVVGCDEGATGVFGAAVNFPRVFAGGVEIGGKWSFLDRAKLAKTPLLLLNGMNDTVVPRDFASNLSQLIQQVGGTAPFHEYPGMGHDCDSPVLYSTAVWKWLFAQRRPPPEATRVPAVPAADVPPEGN